ncbi:MAG: hypothetical protein M3Q58_13665 [Bacteroidota bacterium]|nr:hypothetical protein [Bacteroidota bacterium]
MKNQANIFLTTGCFIALMFSNSLSFGQTETAKIDFNSETNVAECDFLKFEAKYHGDKVYINWVVINRAKESVFVVEHSTNGKEFKSIALKEGAISPGELPLLFSHIHEDLQVSTNYYRIKFYGEKNEISVSNTSTVSVPKNIAQTNFKVGNFPK